MTTSHPRPPPDSPSARWNGADEADEMNRVYVRCGMVPAPVDVLWDNSEQRDALDYLVAVRDDDGSLVGTVTGVDHKRLFDDPENGSSLWTLAVDPTTSLPGVGAALTRILAALYRDRGRAYMDLSVAHDNGAAIAPVREAGLRTRPGDGRQAQERDQRTAVHPSAGDGRRPEPLRADHRRRGDASRDLGRGSRRRGRRNAAVPRRAQRHHPRVVVGVHLRGGDGSMRRQATDAPDCVRGGNPGAEGPARHVRRTRPRVPRRGRRRRGQAHPRGTGQGHHRRRRRRRGTRCRAGPGPRRAPGGVDRTARTRRRPASGGDRRQGGRRRVTQAGRDRRHRPPHRARTHRGAEQAAVGRDRR